MTTTKQITHFYLLERTHYITKFHSILWKWVAGSNSLLKKRKRLSQAFAFSAGRSQLLCALRCGRSRVTVMGTFKEGAGVLPSGNSLSFGD